MTRRFIVCAAKTTEAGNTSGDTASFELSVEGDHCVDQNIDGRNVIKYTRNIHYVTDRDNAWRSSVFKHVSGIY